MPKLSEHTLEKMFPCDYCGESFRTRQGLSGHIQWKHKVEQPLSMGDTSSIIKWAKHLESVSIIAGSSQSSSKANARILARWAVVKTTCDVFNIKPNNQDFKNYIINSFARMYENEDLEERLINRIRTLFDEYKLIT